MQQAYACVMWFPYAGHIEDRCFNYIDYIWELYANAILILCGICQLMYDQLNVWSKVNPNGRCQSGLSAKILGSKAFGLGCKYFAMFNIITIKCVFCILQA